MDQGQSPGGRENRNVPAADKPERTADLAAPENVGSARAALPEDPGFDAREKALLERERRLQEQEARLSALLRAEDSARAASAPEGPPSTTPAPSATPAAASAALPTPVSPASGVVPVVPASEEMPVPQIGEDTPGEPPKRSVFRSVMKAVSHLITVLLILVTAVLVVLMITTRGNLAGSEVFGFRLYQVITGSMSPAINIGDVVLIQDIPYEDIRVDDVITFQGKAEEGGAIFVTHRVMEITTLSEESSTLAFVTRGDAAEQNDPDPVACYRVKGRVALTIPWVGRVIEFTRSGFGLLVIILPAFIIIVVEVIKLIRLARAPDPEKPGSNGKGA